MSSIQSQQSTRQGRRWGLPTVSEQQPISSPRPRPVGIEAGLAAITLAALAFAMVVVFVAASASSTRSGYAEMALMREIEDLRAETALLGYQIHLGESDLNVDEAVADLGMCPADPVRDVDYVLLPHPAADPSMSRIASRLSADEQPSLPARLAQYAMEVIPAGGEAEASTTRGHRP